MTASSRKRLDVEDQFGSYFWFKNSSYISSSISSSSAALLIKSFKTTIITSRCLFLLRIFATLPKALVLCFLTLDNKQMAVRHGILISIPYTKPIWNAPLIDASLREMHGKSDA